MFRRARPQRERSVIQEIPLDMGETNHDQIARYTRYTAFASFTTMFLVFVFILFVLFRGVPVKMW